MIEMGLTPVAWRGMPREDREYLLAIKRLSRSVESEEVAEARTGTARPGSSARPQPPTRGMIGG